MPRILLIDDSPSILSLLEKALRGAGYEVGVASNGKDGLKMAQGAPGYDLILTDIYMPDGDGLELLFALRRLKTPTPVIAMSSATTGPKNMLAAARTIGAKLTLKKPFSGSDLLKAVESVLRRTQPLHPVSADSGAVQGV
jgi:DNA-binding response OmpR family regulator